MLRRHTGLLLSSAKGESRYHMIARGSVTSHEDLVRTMLELGLVSRARSMVNFLGVDRIRPSTALRLYMLEGDFDKALRLGALQNMRTSWFFSQADSNRFSQTLLPLDPATAIQIASKRFRRSHFLPAALLEVKKEIHPILSRTRFPAAVADYHLLKGNIESTTAGKLSALNSYMACFGLGRIAVVSTDMPLVIDNLLADSSSPLITDTELVSVIMTVYNCENYVVAALKSILNQTYKNIEVIVIDDFSSDGSWTKIQSLAAVHCNVKAIRLSDNVGTYAAKNIGMKLAKGKYVTFQDSDDWSHPRRISDSINVLRRSSEVVAVTCGYIRLSDDGRFVSPKVWPFMQWTPNSIVFRRHEVMSAIGYFDHVRFGADSDYVERICAVFGDRAHLKLRLPLIIASHRVNSLMTGSAAGLNSYGYSRCRVEYRERSAERNIRYASDGASLYVVGDRSCNTVNGSENSVGSDNVRYRF